jgi:hypothetical protein
MYRAPRRYRSPYGRRRGGGAVAGITVGVVLASGLSAKAAATAKHAHPHVQHAAPRVTAAAVTGGGETAFVDAVLANLGAPATETNRRSLLAWFPHEYPSWPPWADSNPMSSTLPMPGSWTYNTLPDGLHVQNYPTATEGAQATALTLEGGDWYPQILSALKAGIGLCGNPNLDAEFLTWSGNGYSGVC